MTVNPRPASRVPYEGIHGHDGLAYAALRPSAQLDAEQNQVTRLLHTFIYGGSEKDMPI